MREIYWSTHWTQFWMFKKQSKVSKRALMTTSNRYDCFQFQPFISQLIFHIFYRFLYQKMQIFKFYAINLPRNHEPIVKKIFKPFFSWYFQNLQNLHFKSKFYTKILHFSFPILSDSSFPRKSTLKTPKPQFSRSHRQICVIRRCRLIWRQRRHGYSSPEKRETRRR